ncbi:MAG: hypothetical protein JXA74_15950 [Anaerolineae bacterium]|nr:hypothetical protein [Anaerolineae bacterium]
MSGMLRLLLWLLLGAAAGALHLLLLKGSVRRASLLPAQKAKGAILRGLPLRMLLWVPFLVPAARSGGMACGSLLVGSWLVRLAALWLGGLGHRVTPVSGD